MPGSVGNAVSVWRSILWAILTLEIYAYIWTYRAQLPIAGVLIWFIAVQMALKRFLEVEGRGASELSRSLLRRNCSIDR